MQLLKVYSNKESFRTVEFNETGLSFIVAEQKNPFATEKVGFLSFRSLLPFFIRPRCFFSTKKARDKEGTGENKIIRKQFQK